MPASSYTSSKMVLKLPVKKLFFVSFNWLKVVHQVLNNLKLMTIPSASCSLKHILKKFIKQEDNLYFNYTAEGIPLIELSIKDFT